jgi:hypothetical protein
MEPFETARQLHLTVTRSGEINARNALAPLYVRYERTAETDLVSQFGLSPSDAAPLSL